MRVYNLMIFCTFPSGILHPKVIGVLLCVLLSTCSLKVAPKVQFGAKFVSQRVSTHSKLRHGLGRKRFA